MTERNKDLAPPAAPTVTSNQQSAALARDTERRRVLDILASAATPVDPQLLAAIETGTPAAIVRTNQRSGGANAASRSPAAQGGSGWGDITSRINAEQRAARESKSDDAA